MTREEINRSQNLYIIRSVWKIWAEKDKAVFYRLIGIDDSAYSAFIKNPESNEATRKIEKKKEQIVSAGFQYEWFNGEKSLMKDVYPMITDKMWITYTKSARGSEIYKKMQNIIDEEIHAISNYKDFELYKVYKLLYKHNNKAVVRRLEQLLVEIDVEKLTEKEVDNMEGLITTMDQFIEDVKVMKRYYELQNKKK